MSAQIGGGHKYTVRLVRDLVAAEPVDLARKALDERGCVQSRLRASFGSGKADAGGRRPFGLPGSVLGRRVKNRDGIQAGEAPCPSVGALRPGGNPTVKILRMDRFGDRYAWTHRLQSEGKPDGQSRDPGKDQARAGANH